MVKAVLFDMDGVLCDLRDLHFRAFNEALRWHGYQAVSHDQHVQQFDGLPTVEKLNFMVDRGIVRSGDVDSIRASKQKETLRIIRTSGECEFDPNVYCVLSGLRGFGIRLGVVSNAVGDTVRTVCSRLSLSDLLEVVVSNEDGRPKPAPDLYSVAAVRLGVEPDECLAVEDNKYGEQAASDAGLRVWKVSSPLDVTPRNIWRYL